MESTTIETGMRETPGRHWRGISYTFQIDRHDSVTISPLLHSGTDAKVVCQVTVHRHAGSFQTFPLDFVEATLPEWCEEHGVPIYLMQMALRHTQESSRVFFSRLVDEKTARDT